MMPNRKLRVSDIVLPENPAEFAKLLGKYIEKKAVAIDRKVLIETANISQNMYYRIIRGEYYPSDAIVENSIYHISWEALNSVATALHITALGIIDEVGRQTKLNRELNPDTINQACVEILSLSSVKDSAKVNDVRKKHTAYEDYTRVYLINFRKAVLEHMTAKNLTRKELVANSGLTANTIYAILPTHDELPVAGNIQTYLKIAHTLDIDFHQLIKAVDGDTFGYPAKDADKVGRDLPVDIFQIDETPFPRYVKPPAVKASLVKRIATYLKDGLLD